VPVSIEASLTTLEKWIEARHYKGYDPGDGLTSVLRPLTLGNIFAERVLQQLIWKAPINLRPLVGIVPLESTKGRGFMAWGYLTLFKATDDDSYIEKAVACLEWLDRIKVKDQIGHCWGNHFDFTTRTGRMKAHTPTVVWSSLIGQAFLEGYEVTGQARFLEVAESICEWVLTLPRETTSEGNCLSYTGVYQHSVHNANMLGVGLLSRTWKHSPKQKYLDVARAGIRYTCSRQRSDGSWWYADDSQHRWIDNFHTAYNLDNIKRYIDSTGDETFRPQLDKGYSYFEQVFFEPSGRPRYYHNSTYPVDIQCAAQAIDTFSFFAAEKPGALEMAKKVANWTISEMQDRTGYFYYRKYPLLTAKTPYFHWGQATMFKALSHLLLVERKKVPSGYGSRVMAPV